MLPMNSLDATSFAFECPECDERLEVNDSMKDALVERGCVICESTVTTEAFEQNSISEL